MTIFIPARLAASCALKEDRSRWLAALPDLVQQTAKRWSLSLGAPVDSDEVTCSWVAPAKRRDGTSAILKIGMPHMEAEHEIAALRLLDGDPTIRLLEADDANNTMLLERCEPGTSLRALFQPDQDVVIAGLLKRFWRVPSNPHPFRPLSAMIDHWIAESELSEHEWYDRGLVKEGIAAFNNLSSTTMGETLLATDLHAGNVLRSQREPWLVIDPKPFVGDPAFDATQHLLNCRSRLATDARSTIRRFADMLEVDYERVKLWTFARLAAEPRDYWDDDKTALARLL